MMTSTAPHPDQTSTPARAANPGSDPETDQIADETIETIDAFADSAMIAAVEKNSTAGLPGSIAGAINNSEWQSPYGKSMTKNIWYFAVAGDSLKRGQIVSKVMVNEPVLVGRDSEGKVFAMRDICPHQAVKLSAGHFDGKEVECPFHGWRFDTAGVCTDVPSLCADQKMNTKKICTRSFFCREVLGSVWVYFGNATDEKDLPEVPYAPGLDGCTYHKATTTLLLPTHIDYAVAALIDTAHVPFVHKSWWWRSRHSMKEKAKTYVPSGSGWTMVKHKPSQHSMVFKMIGKYIETEISFRLPGCRREYLSIHDKTILAGITTLTPIDDTHTELNHTTYWTPALLRPFRPVVKPIVDYFVTTFLTQDQDLAVMQSEILGKYKPRLIMTIKDAGTPGHWYFLLKKEWNDATEKGRAFKNPIKETILRWRT
ncbi:MAG: Rieske 2Fe-2S domain-containing protein [Cyanobacteria bacterium REEB67]|nr:Rieske 2Fe-2S domain-containing protein [Cyanobacteria bacterium REEB67]